MTDRAIRVCQIGCGYWGPNLMRNLAASAKAELIGICDPRPDALDRFGARYPGARRYDTIERALAEAAIDAVVIATPSGLHYRHALAALEAGKHVFVEKPLAETTTDAAALVAAAAARGLVLMVGHTFLYNNLVHAVKGHIDDGALGKVYYAYSQRLNLGRFRPDSDVMWTLAPHDVSILDYWFDARPDIVSARGRAYVHPRAGVAEVCFAELEYPAGRAAHLHLSWLDPQKRREMVVVGAKKMLVYDDMNADAHIRLYDKRAEAEHQSETADFADFTTRLRAGDLVIPNLRLAEPLAEEMAHFLDCVRDGRPPRTDGRHGLEVVAVCQALARSMAAGGARVEVDYPAAAAPVAAG